jgi:hypothetical protein
MKMGTIASPWRNDAEACRALKSVKLRRPAILYYAARAAVFGRPGYPSIAAMPSNPAIDVMRQEETVRPLTRL